MTKWKNRNSSNISNGSDDSKYKQRCSHNDYEQFQPLFPHSMKLRYDEHLQNECFRWVFIEFQWRSMDFHFSRQFDEIAQTLTHWTEIYDIHIPFRLTFLRVELCYPTLYDASVFVFDIHHGKSFWLGIAVISRCFTDSMLRIKNASNLCRWITWTFAACLTILLCHPTNEYSEYLLYNYSLRLSATQRLCLTVCIYIFTHAKWNSTKQAVS